MFITVRSKIGERGENFFAGLSEKKTDHQEPRLDSSWDVDTSEHQDKNPERRSWRFFNVFHPDDPIAYRVEPYFNDEYASIAPVRVPHQGGRRLHTIVRDSMSTLGSWAAETLNTYVYVDEKSKPVEEELPKGTPEDVLMLSPEHLSVATETPNFDIGRSDDSLQEFVAVDRLDFGLQETNLDLINESFSAIRSHFEYWDSEDFANFITCQTLEILREESPSDDLL